MTARLSLFDQQLQSESPWIHESSRSQGAGMSDQQTGIVTADSQENHATFDGTTQPPPTLLEQPPSQARTSTPGTLSTATTGSSHVLIDFDDSPTQEPGAGPGPPATPATDPPAIQGYGRPAALQTTELEDLASRGTNQTEGSSVPAPPQPPQRPRTVEEAAQQQEKRAETYSIRHISWKDKTGTLRESPILIQNQNGPCPLLALVNALILRAADHDVQPPIVKALRTREQISLGLLIEALFDELTTRLGPDDEFPDIDALSRFLTMLHTGMNVNPRLTLVCSVQNTKVLEYH